MVVGRTRSVDVAMADFIGGGIANGNDINIKLEGYARQWMVGVDSDGLVLDRDDGHELMGAVWSLGAELHTGLDLLYALEKAAGYFLDKLFVTRAVGLFGGDGYAQLLARRFAFQGRFQAWDDAADAVEVAQRLVVFRTIQNLSIGIGQGVVDGGNLVASDLHGAGPFG